MNRKLLFGLFLLLAFTVACGTLTRVSTPRPVDRPAFSPQTKLKLTSTPTPSPLPPATATPTQTLTAVPVAVSDVLISAPSLKGNLLGDPDQQYVQIILPPSYASSDLRYPVIYFLPGYGGDGSPGGEYFPLGQAASLMASGQINEMILVVPNGANALGGSFYVNSSVTGNWEDYILQDVIGYIDANYRTIPEAQARGIGGHSMGGFAAFNLAMKYPDVFGAFYTLSGGLLGEEGLADFHVLDTEKRVLHFLKIYEEIKGLDEADALRKMKSYDGPIALSMAYGAAFAPNPESGPPYFDYPYEVKDGNAHKVSDAWKRWENGMGHLDRKVQEYDENLRKLRGITIDYARQDRLNWIPRGSEYLARLLSEAGIPNQLYSYDGDHADRIEERLATIMLPFFSQVLEGPR